MLFLQNAAFIWIIPVLFFTIAAAVGLRSLPFKGTLGQQSFIFKRKHNWIMTSLYVMSIRIVLWIFRLLRALDSADFWKIA